MTTFKHMVVYVGRSSVFTDQRFTDKLRKTLQNHEEYGWELINVASRSGPLGDVSGMWMFFKRPEEAGAVAPDMEQAADAAERAA
ncbi:MAG: DUF4177 domain-containing protein [Dehalococcoidia bacterium]